MKISGQPFKQGDAQSSNVSKIKYVNALWKRSRFNCLFLQYFMQSKLCMPEQIKLANKLQITFLKISQQIQNKLMGCSSSPSSSYYKLTLQLPIHCKSNKQRNFIQQLVAALTQSPYFQYVLQLSPGEKTVQNESPQSPKYSSSYHITYCLIQNFSSKADRRLQIQQAFRTKSQKIHNILVGLKAKYRLETKLTFWVKRFNELLKEFEQREVREHGLLKQKILSLQQMTFQTSKDELRVPIEDKAKKQ